MKRDGLKAPTAVHGPLGITYHPNEKANAIADCLENKFTSHWLSKLLVCYDRRSVGQSVLASSTHLGPKTRFYYCQTVAGLLMWSALSDERRICRLQLLLVLASAVILGSESRETNDNILLPEIRDSPKLEGQVPVFISSRNRVAK
jgi:hypothetical protein